MWAACLVVVALVLNTVRAATIAETIATTPFVNIKSGAFVVWFTGDANTNMMTVTMQSNTGGALSFGLGHTTRMYPIDSITGWVSASGVVTLIDEWSPDYNQPRSDTSRGGVKSVSGVSGQQVGTVTTIQFSRQLNTGDAQDTAVVAGQSIYIVWATTSRDGTGSSYPQHSGSNRGSVKVTFPITALTTTTSTPFTGSTTTFTGSTTTTKTTTTPANGVFAGSANFFSSWPFVMEPGVALCLIMTALLGLFALARQLAHVLGFMRRRAGPLHDAAMPGILEEGRRKGHKRPGNACTNWLRGVQTCRVPCTDISLKDLLMVAAYAGLNAGVFVAIQDRYNSYTVIQNTGFLACGNMVMLLLPAMRNGVLGWLLGWRFDQMIGMHHWLGRATIVVAGVHTYYSIKTWYYNSGDIVFLLFETEKYRNGFIAMAAAVLILVTSFGFIRRCAWEFFVVTHLLYVVFFVFAYLHTPHYVYPYIIAVAAIYFTNKLVMAFWGLLPQRTVNVKTLSGNVVCITLPKHQVGEWLGTYGVAQHALVNFPGVSLFQWHPFTLASSPRENFSRIYVKGLGGFTKRLVKHCRSRSWLFVRIDGPYGGTKLGRFPVVVLVAGGIGVTPVISILKDVYDIDVPGDRQRPQSATAATGFGLNAMELQPIGPVRPLWKMLTDEETGEAFYFNSLTGEAQWEKPEDVHALIPASALRTNRSPLTADGDGPAPPPRKGDSAAVGHIRDIYVVWTIQSEDQYAWFSRELAEAQARANTARYPSLHLRVFVTRPKGEAPYNVVTQTSDWLKGRPDLPQKLTAISQLHPKIATAVFACGPPLMVETVSDFATSENCSGNKWIMHSEKFAW